MTDDQSPDSGGGTDTVPTARPDTSPLGRYQARVRRQRTVYFAVVTAIVVLLAVVAGVAWSRGETNNSTLRTVAAAPADVPLAAPAASPSQAWTTSARAAIGTPQWLGTVVLFDRHTVRGVDAASGETTWSYTRSDRTVCTAAQLAGVTIAVYAVRGNCDQVTAVDSGTGERRWTRTLDMDGMPVNGTPVFSTSIQGTYTTLVVRTKSVVYALDPTSGYNRWTYTRYGCDITGAVVGSAGGLISQTCSSAVVCGKLKFCGTGPQLFLLPNGFNRDDDMKDTNPDHIIWNRLGLRATPAAADTLVSAVSGGVLVHLDVQNGKTRTRSPLVSPVGSSPITATDAKDLEILGIGGRVYAVSVDTATAVWDVPSTGSPTVVATSGDNPDASTARITVPVSTGAATVNGNTGKATSASTFPAPPSGSLVYPLGAGFLVASADATTAYA